MPCKCGDVRLVREKLLCPSCDSVRVVDPTQKIEETEKNLQESTLHLDETLKRVNPELVIETLVIEREKAALRCLMDNALKDDAIRRWLSIAFLLSKYPWKGVGTPRRSLVEYLISSAEEILEYENEIFRLKNGLEKIISIDGSEETVPTEFDVLCNIPSEVLRQYEQQFVLIEKRQKNFDLLAIRETMVQPGLPLIIGEEVYRYLKRAYPHRILPQVSPSEAHRFIEISLRTAGIIAFQLGRDFADQYGILKTDAQFFGEVKSSLIARAGAKAAWCFEQLENLGGSPINFGKTVIVKTTDGTVLLPYFSLYLLAHLCLRWEKSPEKGEYYRYIGETLENIIFSFVSAYSVNTDHPISGKPLVRVPHPEKQSEEIADVMVYDSRYLVVIESKFREALTIEDLEVELARFLEKINYIKNNLAKFGLPEKLKIKPFFYVPYPPYSEWNGIKLIPSLVLLGIEIFRFFKPRPINLAPRSKKIQQLLQTIEDVTPYPIDLSTIDQSISPNTYRVHDGVIESYDAEEITVLIDNPIGVPTVLIADISKSIYDELKTKEADKGDVIKMVLLNLNRTWTQIQLTDFKLTGRFESPRNDLDTLGLFSILRFNSGDRAVEKMVLQTWGEETGREILVIVKKWSIDFSRFLQNQIEKGQNVLTGVGKMLGLADIYDNLVQCECGEIMGFRSDFFKVMRRLYPDGIRCSKCDPEQLSLLKEIGYRLVKVDYSAMMERKLRDSKGKR